MCIRDSFYKVITVHHKGTIEGGDYTTELGLGETVGGVVDKTEEV